MCLQLLPSRSQASMAVSNQQPRPAGSAVAGMGSVDESSALSAAEPDGVKHPLYCSRLGNLLRLTRCLSQRQLIPGTCRSGEHTSVPAQQTSAQDILRPLFNTAVKPTRSRASESATPALQRARSPQARLQSLGSQGANRGARAGTPNSVYAQGTAAFFRRASSPQGSQVLM